MTRKSDPRPQKTEEKNQTNNKTICIVVGACMTCVLHLHHQAAVGHLQTQNQRTSSGNKRRIRGRPVPRYQETESWSCRTHFTVHSSTHSTQLIEPRERKTPLFLLHLRHVIVVATAVSTVRSYKESGAWTMDKSFPHDYQTMGLVAHFDLTDALAVWLWLFEQEAPFDESRKWTPGGPGPLF